VTGQKVASIFTVLLCVREVAEESTLRLMICGVATAYSVHR